MAYPYGLPSVEVSPGNFRGTSPGGIQRILGQSYMNQGIIPGPVGTGVMGTSGWQYRVVAGAVFAYTSTTNRTGVVIPFEDAYLPCDPAPTNASRTDTVWVDLEGTVRLNQGSKAAGGAGEILGSITLPAGAGNTAVGVPSYDRRYAIPAGASLGLLHAFLDPGNDGTGNPNPMTLGTGRISLPSDRIVQFKMTHCYAAAVEGEQSTVGWRIYIDNVLVSNFTTRMEGTSPSVNYMEYSQLIPMGSHTVHYQQYRVGGGEFVHKKGGAQMWPGNRFEVWDGGPAL